MKFHKDFLVVHKKPQGFLSGPQDSFLVVSCGTPQGTTRKFLVVSCGIFSRVCKLLRSLFYGFRLCAPFSFIMEIMLGWAQVNVEIKRRRNMTRFWGGGGGGAGRTDSVKVLSYYLLCREPNPLTPTFWFLCIFFFTPVGLRNLLLRLVLSSEKKCK